MHEASPQTEQQKIVLVILFRSHPNICDGPGQKGGKIVMAFSGVVVMVEVRDGEVDAKKEQRW